MARVLVVEDDEDIRLTTIEFLEMEGIPASGCVNGRDALEYLAREEVALPELILVDLAMPVLNGIGFREAQLSDPRVREIPCVIMSADGRIDEKCRTLGIKVSLRKPTDSDLLLKTVRDQLEGARNLG